MTQIPASPIERLKVLITVKTYPTLSSKYDETVCTAGISEDGRWIRLYPIPFRKLDYQNKYKKYAWVELDAMRNKKDFRPESYRPVDFEHIQVGEPIPTDGGAWLERRKWVTDKVRTFTNLGELIADAKDPKKETSLALFKPTEILDFYHEEEKEKEWNQAKVFKIENQLSMFDENPFKVVDKLPYKFKFRFRDDAGVESNLMIEDWETGMLYWNCLARAQGDEAKACADVRRKYFDDFTKTKDLHFFLGTLQQYHRVSPNPFVVIGTFHPKQPPPETQLALPLEF